MENLTQSSKILSFILRHRPEKIGLSLDKHGWAGTDELLEKLNQHGHAFNFDLLKKVVEANDKQRFAFSPDFSRIRANQGHSVQVDLNLAVKSPPKILFHGTAEKNLESIKKQGLVKGKRHHVHLSADQETAKKVGGRHGKPLVLMVLAGDMAQAGYKFYSSENGVWLTDEVPPEFLEVHS